MNKFKLIEIIMLFCSTQQKHDIMLEKNRSCVKSFQYF